jgi:predicted metal-binding membrane protein
MAMPEAPSLLAWTLVGLPAHGVYLGSSALMGTLSPRESAVVGGGALLLAGAYQLTRYKTVCLRHCRTPLDFMLRAICSLRDRAQGGDDGEAQAVTGEASSPFVAAAIGFVP